MVFFFFFIFFSPFFSSLLLQIFSTEFVAFFLRLAQLSSSRLFSFPLVRDKDWVKWNYLKRSSCYLFSSLLAIARLFSPLITFTFPFPFSLKLKYWPKKVNQNMTQMSPDGDVNLKYWHNLHLDPSNYLILLFNL